MADNTTLNSGSGGDTIATDDIGGYFWARVQKGDGCWEWSGPRFNHGYGCAVVGKGKRRLAHRVSWELTRGSIGDLCVLHKCDNRLCVRPDHLFLGTYKDNAQDMMAKGRDYRGEPQRGEKNPASKLTTAQVDEISRAPKRRGIQRMLAQRFGVSEATISLIRSGRRWAWQTT